MKPGEFHNQLDVWCSEEVDALKAKGASDEDLKEPAFAMLVLRTVLAKYADEIRSNPGFRKAVFRLVFEKATPELLRAWAKREHAESSELVRQQKVRDFFTGY